MGRHVLAGVAALRFTHRAHLLAVLVRGVVLLAVLMKSMMTLPSGPALVLGLGCRLVQLLDEPPMRLFTVLPFGVPLRAGRALPSVSHR